jgi:alpha-tubulin suppressor-like RCC1 family protein
VLAFVLSLAGVTLVSSPAMATPTISNMYGWGYNFYGYVGDGSGSNVSSPTAVTSQKYLTQVSAGPGVLALHNDGTVTAWGKNDQGQLGTGGTSYRELSPVNVQVPPVVEVSAGQNAFGLARAADGTVYSWGDNSYAQLGRTISGSVSATPTPVSGLPSTLTQLSTGASHSLGVTSGNKVWAWGRNNAGQLGDPTKLASTYAPFEVPNLSNIVQVAGGNDNSYALDSTGDVWAWGFNYTKTPTKISGLSNITKIAGGFNHGLAVDTSGNVWAWGSNQYGQVGDNGSTGWRTPVQLSGLSSVASVSATNSSSFAVTSSGVMYAWGVNWFGQLGDGTTTQRNTPYQITSLSDVKGVTSNSFATITWGTLPTSSVSVGTISASVTPTTPLYTMTTSMSLSSVVCPAQLVVTVGTKVTHTKSLCTSGSGPTSTSTNVSVLNLDPSTSYSVSVFVNDPNGVSATTTGSLTTPGNPVFVAVGDSYPSGHNQSQDDLCNDLPFDPNCINETGATHLTRDDPSFGWPTQARNLLMSSLGVPSRWQMDLTIAASSGARAIDFPSALQSGCPGCGQEDQMVSALTAHSGSWNIVTLNGGANDAEFSETLRDFYINTTGAGVPWNRTQRYMCPDFDSLETRIGNTIGDVIDTLEAVIGTAHMTDSNVRTLVVTYPYVVEETNICAGESSITAPYAGAYKVIDDIDSQLAGLASVNNTEIVDLRDAGDYATDPVSLTQTTRYFGYPHPNEDGQELIAQTVVTSITS